MCQLQDICDIFNRYRKKIVLIFGDFFVRIAAHKMEPADIRNKRLSLSILNEDCVDEILNRLQTNELSTISRTCKHLYELVAIKIRRLHPNKFACMTMRNNQIHFSPEIPDVILFGSMFFNIIIRGEGRHIPLNDILVRYIAIFCSPRVLRFEMILLRRDQLEVMKHSLKHVETLILHDCGMTDDFYDCLLQQCPDLLHLIVSDSDVFVEPAGNKWLYMKYPTLKRVHLCSAAMVSFQREHWTMFFHQNPQIERFSCDLWCLPDSSDRPIEIITRNAPNLTHLYISLREIGGLNATYYDLATLCQKETFECLELQLSGSHGSEYLNKHSELLASMGKLHAIHLTDMIITAKTAATLAPFVNLKRIYLTGTSFESTKAFREIVSNTLVNLEEVHCERKNPVPVLFGEEARNNVRWLQKINGREGDIPNTFENDERVLLKVRNSFHLSF